MPASAGGRRAALWLLVATAGLVLVAVAVTRFAGTGGDPVLVRVNGEEIPRSAIEALNEQLARELGGRDPAADRALLEALIDQELLFQRGVEQGLLESDPVVRRRVVQLVLEQVEAGIDEPTDAELNDYYETHAQRYRQPAQIRFDQLYFPAGASAPVTVSAAVAELASAVDSGTEMARRAGRWPHRLRAHDPRITYPRSRIESLYGPGFAADLFAAPLSAVAGPMESSLGRHAVWVHARTPAQPRPLTAVRAQVARDWRQQARQAATRELLEELRSEAEIEVNAP